MPRIYPTGSSFFPGFPGNSEILRIARVYFFSLTEAAGISLLYISCLFFRNLFCPDIFDLNEVRENTLISVIKFCLFPIVQSKFLNESKYLLALDKVLLSCQRQSHLKFLFLL